jgi:hypothetical protein
MPDSALARDFPDTPDGVSTARDRLRLGSWFMARWTALRLRWQDAGSGNTLRGMSGAQLRDLGASDSLIAHLDAMEEFERNRARSQHYFW